MLTSANASFTMLIGNSATVIAKAVDAKSTKAVF